MAPEHTLAPAGVAVVIANKPFATRFALAEPGLPHMAAVATPDASVIPGIVLLVVRIGSTLFEVAFGQHPRAA